MMRHRDFFTLLFACFLSLRAAAEPGLLAEYSDGAQKVSAIVPSCNFVLKADESIAPQLAPAFRAIWGGFLNVVARGKYTFSLPGGGTLQIDAKPVGGPIELDVGLHAIRIDYVRKAGPARLQFVWSSDSFLPEPVPPGALSHKATPPQFTAQEDSDRGRLLVESFNCVACHGTGSIGITDRTGPDLTYVGDRLRASWIFKWLEDPKKFRHNALMPRLPLTAQQRADITAYLVTLKDPNDKIKEESSKPIDHVKAGTLQFLAYGCTACHGDKGEQKFSLSDLGSKWKTQHLAAFLENPLVIDHGGRMPSMLLNHDEARNIAEYLTESHDKKYEESGPAGNASRGRELTQSQGCVQCHTIEKNQRPNGSFTDLETLHDGKGCLADQPSGKAMDYRLSPEQRKLIVAFIESVKAAPLISKAPVTEFYHRVATLGCANCHELDGVKPPDVSDRIPQLTNIGARLRVEWMRQVLSQRKRVRPWLHRRMPEFGAENVADLPALAVSAAGAGPVEKLPTPTRDVILSGQKLLGTGQGGFACITCHGFNGNKPPVADDTRGPDITTVAERLRPDHFRRWVYDPKRVDPATPMPTFFEGVPMREVVAKIETMLLYCSTGSAMPPPIGWIDENNYTLVVRDRPLVVRCVMPNANGGWGFARGIGVGLPGLVNYCFDADSCAVRYAWTGGFLDMKPSWPQRGGGEVHILGKPFWGTNYPPLDIGGTKPKFQGYSLLPDGSPQWNYRIGQGDVTESVSAVKTGFGIVRKLEIDPHAHPITLTIIDHQNVDVQCSAGAMQPEQVQYEPGKPAKKPAHVMHFAGDKPVTFTLTITPKETK